MPLPHPFIGHRRLRAALVHAHRARRLPGTILIHGDVGRGKQTLALWLARAILCPRPDAPCGECRSCRLSLRLEHPDIHWHFPQERPKGASSPARLRELIEAGRVERLAEFRKTWLRPPEELGVQGIYLEAVREIREAAHKYPAEGSEQIFIIGNAEYLAAQEASEQAANALLKILEEPPDRTRFILTTSRPASLLETIRSRSLPIHLPPLPAAEIADFLVKHAGADEAAAEYAARLSGGSIGLAAAHLDPDSAFSRERASALKLLKTVLEETPGSQYTLGLDYSSGAARKLPRLLDALSLWIRDLAAISVGDASDVWNQSEAEWLSGVKAISPEQAARAASVVAVAQARAHRNVNPQLLIASMLIGLRAALRPETSARRRSGAFFSGSTAR